MTDGQYIIMDDYNRLARGGKPDSDHIRHCFDYLREALMCHGDTTIEGLFDASVGNGEADDVPKGARFAMHVCKDYAAVVRWATDHRTNDFHGIDNVPRPDMPGHHGGRR